MTARCCLWACFPATVSGACNKEAVWKRSNTRLQFSITKRLMCWKSYQSSSPFDILCCRCKCVKCYGTGSVRTEVDFVYLPVWQLIGDSLHFSRPFLPNKCSLCTALLRNQFSDHARRFWLQTLLSSFHFFFLIEWAPCNVNKHSHLSFSHSCERQIDTCLC